MLGYPERALADADRALEHAHEASHAGTLMYAYLHTLFINLLCGEYPAASQQSNELLRLADEKGAALWKALGTMQKGCTLAPTDRAAEATEMITSGIATYRSTGSRVYLPFFWSHLATAHAQLEQFDDAWRCIGEAMTAAETTKERWCEAEFHRIAGEIALKLPRLGASQAEACFERALAVARVQQAKSWELRAATSLARLWRDRGMPDKARALLAPIHGWFSEGFATHDLKQAKASLAELSEK
jgi:predicted ATPase